MIACMRGCAAVDEKAAGANKIRTTGSGRQRVLSGEMTPRPQPVAIQRVLLMPLSSSLGRKRECLCIQPEPRSGPAVPRSMHVVRAVPGGDSYPAYMRSGPRHHSELFKQTNDWISGRRSIPYELVLVIMKNGADGGK